MPAYEHDGFEPPAPVARVVVGALDGSAEVQGVAMLLDTGADVSVVPRAVADRLGITAPVRGARAGVRRRRPKRMSPTCGSTWSA